MHHSCNVCNALFSMFGNRIEQNENDLCRWAVQGYWAVNCETVWLEKHCQQSRSGSTSCRPAPAAPDTVYDSLHHSLQTTERHISNHAGKGSCFCACSWQLYLRNCLPQLSAFWLLSTCDWLLFPASYVNEAGMCWWFYKRSIINVLVSERKTGRDSELMCSTQVLWW